MKLVCLSVFFFPIRAPAFAYVEKMYFFLRIFETDTLYWDSLQFFDMNVALIRHLSVLTKELDCITLYKPKMYYMHLNSSIPFLINEISCTLLKCIIIDFLLQLALITFKSFSLGHTHTKKELGYNSFQSGLCTGWS